MENKLNESLPCQRNTNYLSIYIINNIFLSSAIIAFAFYFTLSLSYIKANLSRKNLLTFWFDYIVITTVSIIAFMLYFAQQIQFAITERINNTCFLCNENKFICNGLNYSFVFLMLLCTINLMHDIIRGFTLIKTSKEVSSIAIQTNDEIIAKLKSININKTIDKRYHIKELIVTIIAFVIILIAYFVCYNIQPLNTSINFLKWFFISYRLLYLIIVIMLFVMAITLTYFKRNLQQNNFYSNNITIQRIYNSNRSKLAYYCDFLTYKTTIDIFSNIPVLLYLVIGKMNAIHMVISYISLFIYLFYSAILFIYSDRLNKPKKSKLMKKMFCLRRLSFHLGAKENEMLFEEFNFDYSLNEVQTLTDLNVTLRSCNEYEQLLFPNSTENNNHVIYFVLFKILYLFYQNNEQIYTCISKKMEEEGTPFMTVNNHLNSNNTINDLLIKDKDRISRISRISCIPIINNQRLTTSFKFKLSTLMNTLEEKEIKRSFRNEYRAYLSNLTENDIEFKIESLFNTNLFPLFPFYQLTIQDLLRSLDPSNNKELFNLFKENVERNKNYNEFYTKDSFLFFELYDKSFLSYEKLKDFFNSYQAYLLDVIKNFNYTFLPLIIGIYHVSFLNFDKLIILYRHQLSFSPFVKFNNWIKFLITEIPEETVVSQRYTDIIDVNEIEIKNNIKLNIEEYNEVERNIKNDVAFIRKLPFKVYPKLNLFVGNQISNQPMLLNESRNETSINLCKDDFDFVFRDSVYFGDNATDSNPDTKEFGSEIGSLFEKEYEIKGNEGRFVIKIFFSMLFRETCLINVKDNHKYKLESGYYCD